MRLGPPAARSPAADVSRPLATAPRVRLRPADVAPRPAYAYACVQFGRPTTFETADDAVAGLLVLNAFPRATRDVLDTMASINIGGENAGDAFYRYKMPRLRARVRVFEGVGSDDGGGAN